MTGKSPAILKGQINVSVRATRSAAPTRALTLKTNSVFPKWIRHLKDAPRLSISLTRRGIAAPKGNKTCIVSSRKELKSR